MKNSVISRILERRAIRNRWRQTFAAMLNAAILEPRRFDVTRQSIPLRNLPREFRGFRIVQLSDIHHSPFLGEAEIAEAARRANELKPDLVVLTGDYVSHSPEYIPGCARALGLLRAPHGVHAILGNHDHWTDGEMMAAALRERGINVLINQSVRIEREGAHFQLAGIDDLMVGRDDLEAALAGTYRSETRILLAHNPAIIRRAARAGVDLMLSGHTHGGQINWRMLVGREDRPFGRWLRRPSRRMMRGYARFGETQLYVNRGLGTVIVPLRYGCSPEITLLELTH
ncbi:MAG: metallophosphoesterase [Blastocatellia bacterium]